MHKKSHSALLLLFTVQDLRFDQIYYRFLYYIRSKTDYKRVKDVFTEGASWSAEPLLETQFVKYSNWERIDIENLKFDFLNNPIQFGASINWASSDQCRLWCYNLHYFQYILLKEESNSKHYLNLIFDWISKNPPSTPNAWDPFPISLRIVNWIKFILSEKLDTESVQKIFTSLQQQGGHLESQLEYHLYGNHLFKNGKALFFLGLLFDGCNNGRRWLSKGLTILSKECDEQILNDGGHFERSPMYHSMIFEDCLDIVNFAQSSENENVRRVSDRINKRLPEMAYYLNAMTHPDREIALFNDAAFGIEVKPDKLLQYYETVTGEKAKCLDSKVFGLSESGYYILSPLPENKMIIDCGPVGPKYQPGHSHCDTLSFELSISSKRVIVDSGCFQYEDSEIRRYNRGNQGHNTITVDGENQSEVWGAHRCARKAMPIDAICEERKDGALFFRGSHDGYRRLKGRPIHHRSIEWLGSVCTISDEITGRGRHDIQSRLHIHPDFEVKMCCDVFQILQNNKLFMTFQPHGEGEFGVVQGWYCPEFGKKLSCPVLEFKAENVSLPFHCGWTFTISE